MARLQSMFRSQLVFDDQRSLFDYWYSKCDATQLPKRSDISPAEFVRYLPMVSLLDVCGADEAKTYRVRLAGTGLHTYYQQEITGKQLDELYEPEDLLRWNRVLDKLVERKLPLCGAASPELSVTGNYAQFWMRLPLVDDDGQVHMVLAYDIFTPLSALSPDNRARVIHA